MMKQILISVTIFCFFTSNAQINLDKAIGAASKGVKAIAFNNDDAIKIAKQGIDYMDKNNPVAKASDPYAIRLNKLFSKHSNEDGLKLNFKVYKVSDINAFACADGSVRVFSSLMDILTDGELLAVIGHEIGHVLNQDSKDAMKSAYLRAAAMEAASSSSGTISTLNDSQLGELTSGILDASHSRKQESQADDYSYEFMYEHKYDVVAGYTAFKKLALLSEGADQKTFQKMFNSHPNSEKRATNIMKKATKDGLWKDPGEVVLPKKKLTK